MIERIVPLVRIDVQEKFRRLQHVVSRGVKTERCENQETRAIQEKYFFVLKDIFFPKYQEPERKICEVIQMILLNTKELIHFVSCAQTFHQQGHCCYYSKVMVDY